MISPLLVLTRWLADGGLTAFAIYSLVGIVAALRWRRALKAPDSGARPQITLLVPLCGADPESFDNLRAVCDQTYPSDRLQILFGAIDPDDSALEVARRIQALFPERRIEIVSGRRCDGTNLKVANLLQMAPHAVGDILIFCDSDMRAAPGYVESVARPFIAAGADGKVGLVTCIYRGVRASSLATVLQSVSVGADFIPGVLVSRMLAPVNFALGSTIAVTREALAAAGGLEGLANELADDYRLGSRVRAAGFRVVISDYVVNNVMGAEPLRAMLARRLRWARTIRACRPAGYAGSLVTHGLAWGLFAALVSRNHHVGLAILLGTLALRAVSTLVISGATGDALVARYVYLLPLSDLVTFLIFAASYLGNQVSWRGRRFRVLPGGALEDINPVASL